MPADKDLKRLVRQRMARTGESYSTARMRVLARRGIGEDHPMQFHGFIDEEGGRRYVVLTGVPPEYEFVAEHTFERHGDGGDGGEFRLEYQGDPDDFDQVITNWQRDGAARIERTANGLPSGDWAAALEAAIGRLDGSGVWWYLLGSAALAVRGIDVQPQGVDIGTDRAGSDVIRKLFRDRALIPVADAPDWHVSVLYGRYSWHSIIQVTAEPRPWVDDQHPRPWGHEGLSRLETVKWPGHDLLVTPLDLQLDDEKRRDRKRNVTAIVRWMNR